MTGPVGVRPPQARRIAALEATLRTVLQAVESYAATISAHGTQAMLRQAHAVLQAKLPDRLSSADGLAVALGDLADQWKERAALLRKMDEVEDAAILDEAVGDLLGLLSAGTSDGWG